jgi:probable phosphoglycerate mutase
VSLVVLVRHAHSQANAAGILSGRRPNIALSEKGRTQAQELAIRLGELKVKELRVSPLQRCIETIDPWVSTKSRIRRIEDHGITEVDYGKWSGRTLRSLSREKLWKIVQENPSRVFFPDGEGMANMQARAIESMHLALASTGTGAVVMVSHGDVIKALVAANLGMRLDDFQRIIIDPASVTLFDFSSKTPRLLLLNDSHTNIGDLGITSTKKRLLVGGGSGPSSKKKSK